MTPDQDAALIAGDPATRLDMAYAAWRADVDPHPAHDALCRAAFQGGYRARAQAALSRAPLDRVAVARVIDPQSWRNFDYWQDRDMTEEQLNRLVAPSLAKADQIIALCEAAR